MRPLVRGALCAIPLVAGVLVAVGWVVAAPAARVVAEVSPAVIAVAAGLLVTAVLAIVLLLIPALRERRRVQVRAAAEAAAEAERAAHRRFLARLDHELKNPVTAIRTALAEGEDTPAENLGIARGQAARLSTLVGSLRALADLETRAIEHSPVDVAALAEEEVDALREELAARGGARRIGTVFPTVPWPLPSVSGDADLLGVAVRNVLLNAVKYSDEGAQIEVRGSEAAGTVVVEVADTGWGIPEEDLPYVWDELYRARAARGVEGSGLGLSLVRVVVERHGGTVSLASRAGSGTRVRLSLPVA